MEINRTQTQWRLVALVGILLAAFILRVATLDRRPLHFDEGNSVYFSQFALPELLQASIDTHEADPPGYRLSLGVWISLAGPSPIAIRLYSVFFGMLGIAALYALLRALGLNFGARLIATGLLAGAAFSVDYSQQAKGYAMGATMALLSWWTWVRVMRRHARRPLRAGLVYAITTLLMLSTHYYTAALLPMQWLWWLGSNAPSLRKPLAFAREHLRDALNGVGFQALACAPMLMWTALSIAGILSGAAGLSREVQPAAPFALLGDILREMSVGQFTDALPATAGMLMFSGLAVIGAVRQWRCGYRKAFWFGISLLLPLAISIALQQRVTFFYPRFLLYTLPCLCVMIAGIGVPISEREGIVATRLRPVLLGAGILALSTVNGAGALALVRAPIDETVDFRPLFAQIRPLIQQDDAALGSYIWMQGMMFSYAPESGGRLRWHKDHYSARNIEQVMAPIKARRIWSFSFRRNPDARETLSVMWLKRHAAYADRFSAGTLAALLFDATPAVTTATRQTRFGRSIQLGYDPLRVMLRRGDTVPVTLNWSTVDKLSEHNTIFMHLVAIADGRLVAQNDGDAVNGMAPDFSWTPNQTIVDQRALLVRDDLAPGDYILQVGMYRAADGARLKTTDGVDSEQIGTGTVMAARQNGQ